MTEYGIKMKIKEWGEKLVSSCNSFNPHTINDCQHKLRYWEIRLQEHYETYRRGKIIKQNHLILSLQKHIELLQKNNQ